jgi:hypothetical protein
VSFLKKLFGLELAGQPKPALKRTPEVLASMERIEARRQKELKQEEEQRRRERLVKSHKPADRTGTQQNVSANAAHEAIKDQEKKALQTHKDRLMADSGMTANSRMNLWFNTIAPEEPPDTIAPDMRIPETVFDVETNKFEK